MASNDSGVDSSNDSNDGGAALMMNQALPPLPPSISPALPGPAMPPHSPNLSPPSPALLPIPPNLPATVASAAAQSWHNINPNAFQLNSTHDEFALPHSFDSRPSSWFRPSSLPSGSQCYKMRVRVRAKQRLRSNFPSILAESNGRKLRTAASTCNIDLLTRVLDSGADPNLTDEYKRSPLHLASCRGYVQIVQQLLKFGANPNVVDSLGNTPLHLAVISASSNNFNVVVRVLLQGGASVHVHDRSGKTPLDLAESKLRLLRTRYNHSTPESAKILEDMCVLTTLILRYLAKQQQDLDNLTTLEQQLQRLSTSDEPVVQEAVVSQTADALLASVERLSLGK